MAKFSKYKAGDELLETACDLLAHYHMEHTKDKVTRFRGEPIGSRPDADIYVVSDPEWRRKIDECVAPIMLTRIRQVTKQ